MCQCTPEIRTIFCDNCRPTKAVITNVKPVTGLPEGAEIVSMTVHADTLLVATKVHGVFRLVSGGKGADRLEPLRLAPPQEGSGLEH